MNTVDYTILRISIARRNAQRYDLEAAQARNKADRAECPRDRAYWQFQTHYATTQAELWRNHVRQMEAEHAETT